MPVRRRWATGRVAELLPAATLLVMGLVEAWAAPALGSRWQQAALAVCYAGALAGRLRWPVPVLAVVVATGPVLAEVTVRGGVLSYVLAAMLAAWTVGRHLGPPASWWGPALVVGVGWTVYAVTGGGLSDFAFVALLYGGSWAVGSALRLREERIAHLAEEAGRLRREQALREAQAATEERLRIARELHDVVSHSLSVVTVQTQAIRRRLGPGSEHTAEALRAVEATARDAGAEMRRLLGVLRADRAGAPDLAPQPGLAQLPRLLADTRAAGLAVELRCEGGPAVLPPGVDLAAYRVVQEALTNVRRHAGAARCVVSVRHRPGAVELQVDDDGRDRAADRAPGHGITGMSERVALYGGALEVGSRGDGGYRVRATLPVDPAALP